MNRRALIPTTVLLAAAVLTGCGQTTADGAKASENSYPEKGKSIELVVAFAPGGAVDGAARLVAPLLEKELGTNVEVVNKPGAGGQIGYTALTSAAPDGYTIGATGSPSVVVSPLDPSRGAKYTRASFEPLARQVVDPQLIAVAPDSPYKTADDLIAAAKAQPGKLRVTTTGVQTGEHFTAVQLQELTGAQFNIVHFSEGSESALTAFRGGNVEVYVGNVSDVKDLADQGQIRVLGVLDEQRSAFLPDVPTFKEQGIDLEAVTVRGYSAPAGLPADAKKKLEDALKKAIEDKGVQDKMTALGLETRYLNGADYESLWKSQEATYKDLLPLTK
jgi:tripartite-type tricarboxylate transporter receptor subunit TctC